MQFGTYSFAAIAPTQIIKYNLPDLSEIDLEVPVFPEPKPQLSYIFQMPVLNGKYVFDENRMPVEPFPTISDHYVQVYLDGDRSFMIIVHPTCIVAYFSIPVIETDVWADNLRSLWLPYMTLCDVPEELKDILV